MPNENHLAENLRCLIRAYDKTQIKLAEALGVTRSAVSQWVSGKKEPSFELLELIARRYRVTIDQLRYSDLTLRKPMELPKSKRRIYEDAASLFPCIRTDSAEIDTHFVLGYRAHKHLLDPSTHNVVAFELHLETAINEYRLAIRGSQCCEAACNLVSLYFLAASALINQNLVNQLVKAPDNTGRTSSLFNKAFLGDIPVWTEQDLGDLHAFAKSTDAELTELLELLQSNHNFRDYAEYYLAVRYSYGLVDNDLGMEMNSRIGGEMLEAFANIGNKHARHYFAVMLTWALH